MKSRKTSLAFVAVMGIAPSGVLGQPAVSMSMGSCFNASVDARAFSSTAFDYIVIGSGPGGLPLATRLSEDPNVVVGLIEAGYLHWNDPLVDMPGFSGVAVGNPEYDWNFVTTPQKNALGRQLNHPRGKMIGGSSGLNFFSWDRASKKEYDAWAKLGGEGGWDYETLLPYFKKSESLSGSTSDPFPGTNPEMIEDESPEVNGFGGPIQNSYNDFYSENLDRMMQSWNNMNVSANFDTFKGKTVGVRNQRLSIDRTHRKGTRSYAGTNYFCKASHRKNLVVIQGATATKVLLSDQDRRTGLRKAQGVAYSVGGTTWVARSKKEVIVSAGTLQTPQVLELSGIGNPTLLKKYGIEPLIDLPGVGENLMDQIYVPSQWRLVDDILTLDKLRNDPKYMDEQKVLFGTEGKGPLAATDCLVAFVTLDPLAEEGRLTKQDLMTTLKKDLRSKVSTLKPLEKAQVDIQMEWLMGEDVPQAEVIVFSRGLIQPAEGSVYQTMVSGIQHPFSRGSVHLGSSDPLEYPLIDPNYLDFKYDLEVIKAATRLGMRVVESPPASSMVVERQFPPSDIEEVLENWSINTITSGSHPVGTAPMALRSLGGVVDNSLTVHGTSNLRVVDASIVPMSLATHTQATVYAISEKAADIIKCKRGAEKSQAQDLDELLVPRPVSRRTAK